MEWFVLILAFLAVILIAALLFGGWLIVATLRFTWHVIKWMFGAATRHPSDELRLVAGSARDEMRCPNELCRAANPSDARFCRRCGRAMPAAQQVQVRRAAVW